MRGRLAGAVIPESSSRNLGRNPLEFQPASQQGALTHIPPSPVGGEILEDGERGVGWGSWGTFTGV